MSVTILNTIKYAGYTQNEKEMFEAHRDATIEMFKYPRNSDIIDSELIEMAERAAFVFVDKFPDEVKNPPPRIIYYTGIEGGQI